MTPWCLCHHMLIAMVPPICQAGPVSQPVLWQSELGPCLGLLEHTAWAAGSCTPASAKAVVQECELQGQAMAQHLTSQE